MGREGLVMEGMSPKSRHGLPSPNGGPTGSVAIVPVTRYGGSGGGSGGGGRGQAHGVAVTNMGMRPTLQPGKSWVRQRPPQKQQQQQQARGASRGQAFEEMPGEFGRW